MDEFKKHIKQTKDLTEQYEQEAEKLAIVKEEVYDMKIDILGSAFGMLVKNVQESIDDWLKINAEKIQQDKDFGTSIKKAVENVIITISQQKVPNIEFKPQIKVDLSPLQSIASDISKQNKSIISLMEKMSNGNKSDELYRLIVAMVGQNKTLIEKGMQQVNYSEQLKSISDAISKDDNNIVKELTVKYFDNGKIEKVIPVYKNNK